MMKRESVCIALKGKQNKQKKIKDMEKKNNNFLFFCFRFFCALVDIQESSYFSSYENFRWIDKHTYISRTVQFFFCHKNWAFFDGENYIAKRLNFISLHTHNWGHSQKILRRKNIFNFNEISIWIFTTNFFLSFSPAFDSKV